MTFEKEFCMFGCPECDHDPAKRRCRVCLNTDRERDAQNDNVRAAYPPVAKGERNGD